MTYMTSAVTPEATTVNRSTVLCDDSVVRLHVASAGYSRRLSHYGLYRGIDMT